MEICKIPLDELFYQYAEPALLQPLTPQQAMELACQVALKGVGTVYKNPLVGAVLVDKEHRFIAASAHLVYGEKHAEANLVDEIMNRGLLPQVQESTLYVTLEPCAHHGKTPPCVDILAQLPLKEVVFGAIDPNPLVQGKGVQALKNSGILCRQDSKFGTMGAHLLEHFAWSLNHAGPFIGLKAAITINGIAGRPGDQRVWITSERSRLFGHWLRFYYESILVGANTIMLDNPTLNIRHPKIKGRTPLRLALDPIGKALNCRPLDQQHLLTVEPTKTLWICEESFWRSSVGKKLNSQLEKLGTETYALKSDWRLTDLIHELANKKLASLLLEGGSQVWSSFLEASLVNKLHVFMAPKLLASDHTMHFAPMTGEIPLENVSLTCLGDDILVEGHVRID